MSNSFELGAQRRMLEFSIFFLPRNVDANTAHCTCRMNIKAKSDICLHAPNSDDMDFFRKLFYSSPQVGNKEATGKISSKNINSKSSKKLR